MSFSHLLTSLILIGSSGPCFADTIDLSSAMVVISPNIKAPGAKIAPNILTEEIAKRTGILLPIQNSLPSPPATVILLSLAHPEQEWLEFIPQKLLMKPSLGKPEGFSIGIEPAKNNRPPVVHVIGADARGLLFGVGKLLLQLEWGKGFLRLDSGFQSALAPQVPLRGHQLGYRPRANSWDSWTPDQFDQYIRELVLFGANAIENVPFQDPGTNPLMKVSREVMNMEMSRICARYGIEYWAWIPVVFTLPDAASETAFLKQQEDFYKQCPRLDGVFVPGGDPGHNDPATLIPFVAKMATLLKKHHPEAKIWLSLQGFQKKAVEDFFDFINRKNPDWLAGLVMGPGSPPLDTTRALLPKKYKLRWYPDITHIIRCQYPVAWMDPALGMTIGREPCNPRPAEYTAIYRELRQSTDGFITYSDGITDDFNKNLWSQLGWDANRDPRATATEYARFFFGSDLATPGADGLFSLEANLHGGLAHHIAVDDTLSLWQKMEKSAKGDTACWRFEIHLMRAYYDAYTRHRLLFETSLEKQALTLLQAPPAGDIPTALKQARHLLAKADSQRVQPDWLAKLHSLADSLFQKIGYQTLLKKHHASGSERSAIMEFIHHPLNNRRWLEDQLDKIEKEPNSAKRNHLLAWVLSFDETGPDTIHEILGHVDYSTHVPKVLYPSDAQRQSREKSFPNQRWLGEGNNNLRLAWHSYLNLPPPMTFKGLDPKAEYTIRLIGQGVSPLVIDGKMARVSASIPVDKLLIQEFEVPATASSDGEIVLSWKVLDEEHLNWRDRHYVNEIWVRRKKLESPSN